jgi:hypothetical protein
VEFLDLADAVVCGGSRSPLEWGGRRLLLLVKRAVQPYIPSQSTASMSKPYCRLILIVLTVACGVCALVTAPIALLTAAMAFDAPDSDYQLWAWIVFFVPVDPAVVRHRCCCWMGSLSPGVAANVSGACGNTARRRDVRLATPPARLVGEGL